MNPNLKAGMIGAKVAVDATPRVLADVLGGLLHDDEERAARVAGGLAYVAARGFDRGARHLLDALGLVPSEAARPDGS